MQKRPNLDFIIDEKCQWRICRSNGRLRRSKPLPHVSFVCLRDVSCRVQQEDDPRNHTKSKMPPGAPGGIFCSVAIGLLQPETACDRIGLAPDEWQFFAQTTETQTVNRAIV